MNIGALSQPGFNFGVLTGAVLDHAQAHLEILGRLFVDPPTELQQLLLGFHSEITGPEHAFSRVVLLQMWSAVSPITYPNTIGGTDWVSASFFICDFTSTHVTTPFSGGFWYRREFMSSPSGSGRS